MLKEYLTWALKFRVDFLEKNVKLITNKAEWEQAVIKQYDKNGIRNVKQGGTNGFIGAGLYDFVTDGNTFLYFNKLDVIMQSGLEGKTEHKVDAEELERALLNISYNL